MPRGRQYYDPIIQVPGKVEGAPTRRIELYPEGAISDGGGGEQQLRWVGRLIGELGEIVATANGSFDHDDALRQAQQLWPGLEVYELREEGEDSTWDGMGPSPRLWQNSPSETGVAPPLAVVPSSGDDAPSDVSATEAEGESIPIRAFAVEAGTYMHVEDIKRLLLMWADQYEEDRNPSAAMAMREAAETLQV